MAERNPMNLMRTLRNLALATAIALVVAACSSTAEPPPPTRTPAPTFTPTIEGVAAAVDPAALATVQAAQQAQAAQPVDQPAVAPSTDGGQPLVESTSVFSDIAAPAADQPVQPVVEPVPATPVPANAELTIDDISNVRGGPGLTYNILGQAPAGQSYPVIGKSPDNQWWQITFNGQPGWVFGELVTARNSENVAVAQNIPVAPPPPTAAPVVVAPPTAVPAPPVEAPPAEQPTPEPAKSNYKFNIIAVSKCDRQPAGNWFEGKTYVGGVPQSGYKVVFSYAPDAPPITEPVISGPHEGYPGWDQGFYSHIIRNTNPIAGDWFVWVVDDAGQRISEIAQWSSTGPGEGCNQAVVDFDSR